MPITKKLTVSGRIIDDLHFLYSYLYFLIYNKNKKAFEILKKWKQFLSNKYTIFGRQETQSLKNT